MQDIDFQISSRDIHPKPNRKFKKGSIVRFREGNLLGWPSNETYELLGEPYTTISATGFRYCHIKNPNRELFDVCITDLEIV